jgi:hypothetical protein
MPCTHKFFGHHIHMNGHDGLLPNWNANTLIIGTFNPNSDWAPHNNANYFYGRSAYFWKALPKYAFNDGIDNDAENSQLQFLQENNVALTDLLISIEDADLNIPDHVNRIRSFRDSDLNIFQQFIWNTQQILRFITTREIQGVYFTKLGGNGIFEPAIIEIEQFCLQNNILAHRLHTPSGQGLGVGRPRRNKLIHKWFNENGGNEFPFLSPNFNINNPEFVWI